jgi:hypothetical protein
MVASTDSLDFATFLVATGRLKFLGIYSNGSDKMRFRFNDPNAELPSLQAQFSAGAVAPVVQTMSAYRGLRQQMEQCRAGQPDRAHGPPPTV